jgi:hypothetical protein
MRTKTGPIAVRFIDRTQRWTRRSTNLILWYFQIILVILRPLGITSVIAQVLKVSLTVGRPGLDPGSLGFEPDSTQASVVVQMSCQRLAPIRRRPWTSSRSCFPGYMIGCIASEVWRLALSKYLDQMRS